MTPRPLQFYDSLTNAVKPLEPMVPGEIGLYVCGVTPYDDCHIGHARTFILFDTMVRSWRALGYQVKYIRNITDVDDKIIQKANKTGESADQVANHFIGRMHEDFHTLGLSLPCREPRVTESMSEIIAFIEALIEKDKAYAADGDVYFSVASHKTYGALSNQSIDDLRAGSRVEVSDLKRNPLDFALWKSAKPGEPAWSSPWGEGRPGWHIECSVMSIANLGKQFDIHGGGRDLIFPHHENEIAQSEACTDCTYANLWLHTGMVNINDEKMSKSLGNFFLIRDVLAHYSPEVLRFFLVSGHYRSPLDYSDAALNEASQGLRRLYQALLDCDTNAFDFTLDASCLATNLPVPLQKPFDDFILAVQNDFNTPKAYAALFDLAKLANRAKAAGNQKAANEAATLLRYFGDFLGILQTDANVFLQTAQKNVSEKAGLTAQVIEEKIAARNAARAAKDWSKADEIRGELTAAGIELEDTADGTRWQRL